MTSDCHCSIPARESAAHHEAAHAVACVRFDAAVNYVSIFPDEGREGHTPYDEAALDLREALILSYAGYAADLECGIHPAFAREGARGDFHDAIDLDPQHDQATWIETARAFVQENWRAIELIAAELSAHQVLTYDELVILVEMADGNVTADDLARVRAISADAIARTRAAFQRKRELAE